MAKRLVRLACVLVVAWLTTHGCIYKKRGGPGTNIGSGWGSDEDSLPPPGQPPARSIDG